MDKINAYATISSYSPDNLRTSNRGTKPQNTITNPDTLPNKAQEKVAARLPEYTTKQAFEATQQKPQEKPSAASPRLELYEPATRMKSKPTESDSKNLGSTINYKA